MTQTPARNFNLGFFVLLLAISFDCLCIVLLSHPLRTANAAELDPRLPTIYALYQKGSYSQALDALKFVETSIADKALLRYWKGLCYARLQRYDQAIPEFQRAQALGGSFEDLPYEFGQALYANQQLRPARDQFQRSQAQGYKIGASLYYFGFISQVLEEYPIALSAFQKIQKIIGDDEKVKQASLLQIAEIRATQASEETLQDKRNRILESTVLPALKKVIEYDPITPVAQQAKGRIEEIRQQISQNTDSPTFRNGVPIALKRWVIRFSEDVKYDTNVLTKAEQSLLNVSNTASFLNRFGTNGKYEFILDRQFSITPEVDFSYTYHTNQSEPYVYQNDSFITTAALRNRWEHSLRARPAALQFDFEYNFLMRDYQQIRRIQFFSRYYQFNLAERFQLFGFGSTTLSAYFKAFSSADQAQNALAPAFTLGQNFNLGKDRAFSTNFTYSWNRSVDPFWERKDYRINLSLYLPSVFWGIDLLTVLDLTLVDPVNSHDTRGAFEKTINPSITLTKWFSKNIAVNLNYLYLNNISQDLQNFNYSKHVGGLGLIYRF